MAVNLRFEAGVSRSHGVSSFVSNLMKESNLSFKHARARLIHDKVMIALQLSSDISAMPEEAKQQISKAFITREDEIEKQDNTEGYSPHVATLLVDQDVT
jgi:hypothetical protein